MTYKVTITEQDNNWHVQVDSLQVDSPRQRWSSTQSSEDKCKQWAGQGIVDDKRRLERQKKLKPTYSYEVD